MIEARRQQLHFGEGLIAEEVSDLREDWMTHADQVLEDEQLVSTRVRGPGETQSEESHSRATRHAGGSGDAAALAEAHPQLELRGVGARSPGQSGISRFHARGSLAKRPMPRPWVAGDWRWGRKESKRSMNEWWRSPKKIRL